MKPGTIQNLWNALNLVEDYLQAGFRRSHPEIQVTAAASGEAPSLRQPDPTSAGQPPADSIEAIAREVSQCTRCGLSAGRTLTVPGEGSLEPPILFVGEGPGAEEDRAGRPFVGAAGRYLDKWISAMGLERSSLFIANCVKCRPPGNREPHPEEIAACLPYLERQIAILKPKAICCLGRTAAHTLLASSASLAELRGTLYHRGGIPLVVTYHPSAVLRDQSLRKPVWEDLKVVQRLLQQ